MGDQHGSKCTTPEQFLSFFEMVVAPAHGYSNAEPLTLLEALPRKYKKYIVGELFAGGFEDSFWAFREAIRFQTEEYKPIEISSSISDEAKGLVTALCAKPEHFIHISVKDPTYVAYTPDKKYGHQDRRIKTTLGRYLKKEHPYLSDLEIRAMSQVYRNQYNVDDVYWATTAKDIERVYTQGPHSCMAYAWHTDSDKYGSHMHPSIVYAEPWFRVAYLMREDRITARCLTYINPEDENDMRWIRHYGDGLIITKLELLGYVKGSLSGARIRRIPAEDRDGDELYSTYVCPYIDDQTGKGMQYLTAPVDDPEYFTIDNRGITAATTTGLVGERYSYIRDNGGDEDTRECGLCGSSHDESDMHYSGYHDYHICEACIDEYSPVRTSITYPERRSYVHRSLALYVTDTDTVYMDRTDMLDDAGLIQLTHPDYDGLDRSDRYVLRDNSVITRDGFIIHRDNAKATWEGHIYYEEDLYRTACGYIFIHPADVLEEDQYLGVADGMLVRRTQNSDSDYIGLSDFLARIANDNMPDARYDAISSALHREIYAVWICVELALQRIVATKYPELLDTANQQALNLETAA